MFIEAPSHGCKRVVRGMTQDLEGSLVWVRDS